jgi:hypothetical protein
MSKKHALLVVLILVVSVFLVVTASAQAPMPSEIKCVEVPGIPCPVHALPEDLHDVTLCHKIPPAFPKPIRVQQS